MNDGLWDGVKAGVTLFGGGILFAMFGLISMAVICWTVGLLFLLANGLPLLSAWIRARKGKDDKIGGGTPDGGGDLAPLSS